MRRSLVIALSVMGVLLVLLALAVASIGTELDEARIERDDLWTEAEDLRQELDAISQERNKLQEQVDEQVKAIESLKVQQERARVSGDIAPSAAGAAPETPVQ
jgi:uncharacterized protein YoxC